MTRLSAWWLSLGIDHLRSRKGTPADNGGHERMHRDIAFEVEAIAAATSEDQQRACDLWKADYCRPHEALGMKTPNQVYKPRLCSHPARTSSAITAFRSGVGLAKADRAPARGRHRNPHDVPARLPLPGRAARRSLWSRPAVTSRTAS